MEGRAIQSCSRLRLSACCLGTCANTWDLSAPPPAASITPGAAANTAPETAPFTKSRRLHWLSLESCISSPLGVSRGLLYQWTQSLRRNFAATLSTRSTSYRLSDTPSCALASPGAAGWGGVL